MMNEPMIAISKEQAKDYETFLLCELEEISGSTFPETIKYGDKVRANLKALRAAPETVSLEGVDRWDPIKEDGCATYDKHPTGALILFSDACRLVAPVQPSAVVSREDIGKTYEEAFDAADDDGYPSTRRNAALDAVFALQLPQPVAPVQGGVPDLMERWRKFLLSDSVGSEWWQMHHDILEKLYGFATTQSAPISVQGKTFTVAYSDEDKTWIADCDGLKCDREEGRESAIAEMAWLLGMLNEEEQSAPVQSGDLATIRDAIAKADHEWENGEADDVDYNGDAIQDIYTVLASLATRQSAPSVPSVLELEQVILPIWYGDDSGKPYAISNAIHALLTERMGTKPFWNASTPEWANYLAQDHQGRWWWFANTPRAGLHDWTTYTGRYALAQGNDNWKSTLEERPE